MTDELIVEVEAGVMTLVMNRPQQRNAMTLEMSRAIADSLAALDARPDVTAAVLTGSGGTFCAGMDLRRFEEHGERPFVPGRGFGGITEAPPRKPIIAAVEGWALGGGFEMALACDMIVAGSSARFGLPEVKRGLVARGGGMLRLPQRVPRAIALEMLLTGEPITAQRAAAIGLANHVSEDGHALSRGVELARSIAANAPLAVLTSKLVVVESASWDTTTAFERQAPYSDAVFSSEDAKEGVRAFAERRSPAWKGR